MVTKYVDPEKKKANSKYQYTIIENKDAVGRNAFGPTIIKGYDDRTGKLIQDTSKPSTKVIGTQTTEKDIYASGGIVGIGSSKSYITGKIPVTNKGYVTEVTEVTTPKATIVTDYNAKTKSERESLELEYPGGEKKTLYPETVANIRTGIYSPQVKKTGSTIVFGNSTEERPKIFSTFGQQPINRLGEQQFYKPTRYDFVTPFTTARYGVAQLDIGLSKLSKYYTGVQDVYNSDRSVKGQLIRTSTGVVQTGIGVGKFATGTLGFALFPEKTIPATYKFLTNKQLRDETFLGVGKNLYNPSKTGEVLSQSVLTIAGIGQSYKLLKNPLPNTSSAISTSLKNVFSGKKTFYNTPRPSVTTSALSDLKTLSRSTFEVSKTTLKQATLPKYNPLIRYGIGSLAIEKVLPSIKVSFSQNVKYPTKINKALGIGFVEPTKYKYRLAYRPEQLSVAGKKFNIEPIPSESVSLTQLKTKASNIIEPAISVTTTNVFKGKRYTDLIALPEFAGGQRKSLQTYPAYFSTSSFGTKAVKTPIGEAVAYQYYGRPSSTRSFSGSSKTTIGSPSITYLTTGFNRFKLPKYLETMTIISTSPKSRLKFSQIYNTYLSRTGKAGALAVENVLGLSTESQRIIPSNQPILRNGKTEVLRGMSLAKVGRKQTVLVRDDLFGGREIFKSKIGRFFYDAVGGSSLNFDSRVAVRYYTTPIKRFKKIEFNYLKNSEGKRFDNLIENFNKQQPIETTRTSRRAITSTNLRIPRISTRLNLTRVFGRLNTDRTTTRTTSRTNDILRSFIRSENRNTRDNRLITPLRSIRETRIDRLLDRFSTRNIVRDLTRGTRGTGRSLIRTTIKPPRLKLPERNKRKSLPRIKPYDFKQSSRSFKYTPTLQGRELGLKQSNKNLKFTGLEIRGV